ncbi:2'-5' RNA ligase family protein [Mangrovivirga sp. M17]|uniref:2'-5' RNA ligase family protein n=1 Tax=Mangrovivirga halotolerans TaxID=2993936 RepID=A0ABT3RLF3_9BACT|nr:2'-5' RNA ligase family protein [Mangrovivirga halotolerans]MCX2742549.1 2'-5' RNA ligase family protein [Mangrovivirga halotolerans]
MTKNQKPLYYIACLVPSPVKGEIVDFMKEIERLVGAKHAQKSPPHITLYPPFRKGEDEEVKIIQCIEEIAKSTKVFEVSLNGFSGFPPRTFYVQPTENPDLAVLRERTLHDVGSEINMDISKIQARPFNPHITIANRDLEKDDYPSVVEYFSNISFKREYAQNTISLLKHNGKNWDVQATFNFAPR